MFQVMGMLLVVAVAAEPPAVLVRIGDEYIDAECVAQGDFDGDGDVDLADWQWVQAHTTGPAPTPTPTPTPTPSPTPTPTPSPTPEASPRPTPGPQSIEPMADWAVYPRERIDPGQTVELIAGAVDRVWGVEFELAGHQVLVHELSRSPRTGVEAYCLEVPAGIPAGVHEISATVIGELGGTQTLATEISVGRPTEGVNVIRGQTFTRSYSPPAGVVVYDDCTWRACSTGYNADSTVYYVDCTVEASPDFGFRAARLVRGCQVAGAGDDPYPNCVTIVASGARDLVSRWIVRQDGSGYWAHGDFWSWFTTGSSIGQRIVWQCVFERSDYQACHSSKGATIDGMLIHDVTIRGPATGGRRNDGRIVGILEAAATRAVIEDLNCQVPFYLYGAAGHARFTDVRTPEWRTHASNPPRTGDTSYR